jgi:hypothetical protein
MLGMAPVFPQQKRISASVFLASLRSSSDTSKRLLLFQADLPAKQGSEDHGNNQQDQRCH